MIELHVKNVSDELYERLTQQAGKHKTTLNDLILNALEREIEQIELHERIAAQPTRHFTISPSEWLSRHRTQRDAIDL